MLKHTHARTHIHTHARTLAHGKALENRCCREFFWAQLSESKVLKPVWLAAEKTKDLKAAPQDGVSLGSWGSRWKRAAILAPSVTVANKWGDQLGKGGSLFRFIALQVPVHDQLVLSPWVSQHITGRASGRPKLLSQGEEWALDSLSALRAHLLWPKDFPVNSQRFHHIPAAPPQLTGLYHTIL